jgi:hypothetical protein
MGHMTGIPLVALPQTFLDAITVTRHLNIRFLWIDSLCIIQDDHSDWVVQSAQMSDIYGGAYLTICASLGEDASHGLFVSSALHDLHAEITVPGLPSTGIFLRPCTAHEKYQNILERDDGTARTPLLQRAWVVQELLLSPRTIHFEKHEIIWSCNETSWCSSHDLESKLRGNAKKEFSQAFMADEPAWVRSWEQVASLYSAKDITIESDRLPALSGVAHRFQARFASVYLAGLWKNNLVRGLCWTTVEWFFSPEAKRPSTYVAPSWSWCSVLAWVHWLRKSSEDDNLTVIDVDVHEASCTPSTSDPTGAVSSGFIRLSGSLALGRLKFVAHKHRKYPHFFAYGDEESWDFRPDARFDDFGPGHAATQAAYTNEGDALYALKLGSCEKGVFSSGFIALILVKTGDNDQEFRRVGISSYIEDIWTRDTVQPQVITIV